MSAPALQRCLGVLAARLCQHRELVPAPTRWLPGEAQGLEEEAELVASQGAVVGRLRTWRTSITDPHHGAHIEPSVLGLIDQGVPEIAIGLQEPPLAQRAQRASARWRVQLPDRRSPPTRGEGVGAVTRAVGEEAGDARRAGAEVPLVGLPSRRPLRQHRRESLRSRSAEPVAIASRWRRVESTSSSCRTPSGARSARNGSRKASKASTSSLLSPSVIRTSLERIPWVTALRRDRALPEFRLRAGAALGVC